MENLKTANTNYEKLTWGALFIWSGVWWGMSEMGAFWPAGAGPIGIGLILLGLNAVRSLKSIPAKLSTTILGGLAILYGGLQVARTVLEFPPFQVPLFPVLLVAIGVVTLGRELPRLWNDGVQDSRINR